MHLRECTQNEALSSFPLLIQQFKEPRSLWNLIPGFQCLISLLARGGNGGSEAYMGITSTFRGWTEPQEMTNITISFRLFPFL